MFFRKTLIIGAIILLATPASSQIGRISQPVVVKQNSLWESTIIPVCWERSGSNEAKDWVRKAVRNTWEASSNLQFTRWGNCQATSKGIRIGFGDREWPRVKKLGRHLNGVKNGMLLNFEFDLEEFENCKSSRKFCIEAIAVHEFGHAIGIAHEHNRPDRVEECQSEPQGANGDWTVTAFDMALRS